MKEKKDYFILLLICIIFSVIYYNKGLVTSGVQFRDDHEFFDLSFRFTQSSFWDVLKKYCINDFLVTQRVRPVWTIHRVLETYLLGANIERIAWYNLILANVTIGFFFLGIRRIGVSVVEAILFLLIIFVGLQSEIWFRLGPAENIATVFFSITFYLICSNKNDKPILNYLWMITLCLSALSKESFLLVIPSMLLFKVFVDIQVFKKEFNWKNYIYFLIPIIVILGTLVYIKSMDTGAMGYAGVDSNLTIMINGVQKLVTESLKYYFILTFIVLAVYFGLAKKENVLKEKFYSLILPTLIFLGIVAPNLLLYAKSGIDNWGRYFLPMTIAFAFYIIWMIHSISSQYIRIGLYLLSLFMLRDSYTKMTNEMDRFMYEGQSISAFVDNVTQSIDKNSTVLVVGIPTINFEHTDFMKVYLTEHLGQKMYIQAVPGKDEKDYTDFDKKLVQYWNNEFTSYSYDTVQTIPDVIAFLNANTIPYVQSVNQSKFNLNDYMNLTGPEDIRQVFVRKK